MHWNWKHSSSDILLSPVRSLQFACYITDCRPCIFGTKSLRLFPRTLSCQLFIDLSFVRFPINQSILRRSTTTTTQNSFYVSDNNLLSTTTSCLSSLKNNKDYPPSRIKTGACRRSLSIAFGSYKPLFCFYNER